MIAPEARIPKRFVAERKGKGRFRTGPHAGRSPFDGPLSMCMEFFVPLPFGLCRRIPAVRDKRRAVPRPHEALDFAADSW